MLRKSLTLADCKMSEEGSGSFSGYGSVFGNCDHSGEIVLKGAFAGCLDRFKAEGFIALQHDYSDLPVATVRDAYEDQKGLFIECDFHGTEEAQKARTYMRERMERGKSVGLSIGYNIRRQDMEKTAEGVLLKAIDLWEVSIVTKPCNPEALATAAKSAETKAQYLGAYAEAEMTLAALYDLVDTLRWRCFWSYLFDDERSAEDREAAFDGCLSEFHQIAMRAVRAYHAAEPEAQGEMATELKSLFPPPEGLDRPQSVRSFQTRLSALLTEIEDATDRAKSIAALREEQGRSLVSPDRREQLLAAHKALGAFLEETAPPPSLDLDILRLKATARRRRLLLAS